MAERRSPGASASLLHELADATQALGNYLNALRLRASGSDHVPAKEIVDRALSQYARVLHTVRELRAELGARCTENSPDSVAGDPG